MRRRVWQARSLKTTGPMPRISKDAARAWSERMKRAPCSPSPAHCSRQALRSRRRLASGVGKTWLSSRCKARRQCRHRNHRRGHCDVGRCGGPVHVSAISRSAPPAASRRSLQSRLPARSVVRRCFQGISAGGAPFVPPPFTPCLRFERSQYRHYRHHNLRTALLQPLMSKHRGTSDDRINQSAAAAVRRSITCRFCCNSLSTRKRQGRRSTS